jgi:ABC-type dipeptide/oligopeptide/nickel transport system permease subunit
MVVILVFLIFAIFAPFIAPYPPNDTDLNNTLSQPTGTHLLGTDALGRDTLSRIIYGARTSLVIGLVAVGISCIVGMGLGLLAGYYGAWTNTIVMRFIDALMSFPMILLALAIAALLGSGMRNVIIALSVALMSGYARLMHGQVLSVKENDYILV